MGQVKSTPRASRPGNLNVSARVWARVAGMSTTVTAAARNGEPIVACSPQFTGRSNPSWLSSSLSTYTTFSPSTMRKVRLKISCRIGSFTVWVSTLVAPSLRADFVSQARVCASPCPESPASFSSR